MDLVKVIVKIDSGIIMLGLKDIKLTFNPDLWRFGRGQRMAATGFRKSSEQHIVVTRHKDEADVDIAFAGERMQHVKHAMG